MKAFCIVTFLVISCVSTIWSQYRLFGFVYDQDEQPYIGIEVRLRSDTVHLVTHTNENGRFDFSDVPRGKYHVVVITGYGLIEREVNLQTSIEMQLQRPRNIRTDEVVVSAVRARDNAPLTFTNLNRDQIAAHNLGQDVPYLLSGTPSLVETSDAGTGFGYTGLRIRGTDATRINVTINGIPLNDAESQAVYWVDLPDLLSSTESIQVQRGVGSSTFGSGAFGASVNLNTVNTETDPHGAVSLSGGSFNTYRASARAGTGLISNHFTLDGRASLIRSDGYIDRASADLKSWFATGAYITANQSVRLNAFGGHEITYQAWNGVPVQYVDDPVLRTYNTAGTERPGTPYNNEVDDYGQTHLQLLWNASVFTQIQTYATLHYTKGKGYYEQYKSVAGFDSTLANFLSGQGLENGDAIRRLWLDNDFYGITGGFHFFDPSDKYSVQIGGAWNRYTGDHFGRVIWSAVGSADGLPDYYFNDAVKTDRNGFVKFNYHFSAAFKGMADLQLRGVCYAFEGLDEHGKAFPETVKLSFFNPKAGISWDFRPKHQLYGYVGIAQREPNRDDYVTSPANNLPKPEKLVNSEIGWKYDGTSLNVVIDAYHMYYRDQLVLTGRLNDVGEYARQNVNHSFRMGVEATASLNKGKWDAMLTTTWSRNKVKAFDEYVDDWQSDTQFVISHQNTPLSFSPSLTGAASVGYHLIRKETEDLRLGVTSKYVGEQYLDNTGNAASRLDAYTYSGVEVSYRRKVKNVDLTAHLVVRNLFDARYSSNGWIYRFRSPEYDPRPDDPYSALEQNDTYHQEGLFPQAGRNMLAGITVSL